MTITASAPAHMRAAPNRPRRRPLASAAAAVDWLEPRLLLAGQYTVTSFVHPFPDQVVAGVQLKDTTTVKISNLANHEFALTDKADIRVFAHPTGAGDASGDRELGAKLNQTIGVKVGGVKTFHIPLTLPADLALGSYDLLVVADAPGTSTPVASPLSGQSFIVADAFVDLVTTIAKATLPTAAVSGSGAGGSVQVTITNGGNVNTPAAQKAQIQLFARPDGGGDDVPLALVQNVATGNLKPGGAKTVTAKFTFPKGLGTGSYHVVAVVTASVSDADTSNNAAAANPGVPVTLGEIDLATSVGKSTVPAAVIANGNAKYSLQVSVANDGNIATAKDEKVQIQVFARPVGGGQDLLLTTVSNVSVGNLAPTKFKTFNVSVFQQSFLTGQYNLVAVVTDNVLNAETNTANNAAAGAATVTVAGPFVDLSADAATTALGGTVAAGKKGSASVTLKNLGNTASTGGYTVEVFATDGGTIDGTAVKVGTATSASAKIDAGKTLKVNVPLTLPEPGALHTYTLVARVTKAGDTNSANDTKAFAGQVTVQAALSILGQLPATIAFTETSTSSFFPFINSAGTFTGTGGSSASGTYTYAAFDLFPGGGDVKLTLTGVEGGPATVTLQPTATLNSLSGKTLVFVKSIANSDGSFIAEAITAYGITKEVRGFFRIL
jgi:hypothetical protein